MKSLFCSFILILLSTTILSAQVPNIQGDFETWQITSQDTIPNSWIYDSPWGSYLGQSTDSYSGNYSAVVNTWYHHAPGWLILGTDTSAQFWGSYNWSKAGIPATTQAHALEGYYKYIDTVSTVDSAVVYILYKHYNQSLGKVDTIAYTRATLLPTATWTYFQIPIQDWQTSITPDSLVIAFSSQWNGAGTGFNPYNRFLYLDNLSLIYLTTAQQKLETSKQLIDISSNPNQGIFELSGLEKTDKVQLIGLDGRNYPILRLGNRFQTSATKGFYLLKIYDKTQQLKTTLKLIINK